MSWVSVGEGLVAGVDVYAEGLGERFGTTTGVGTLDPRAVADRFTGLVSALSR